MRITLAILALLAVVAPALAAAEYPVSGKWGEAKPGDQGAVDCSGRRIIAFNGNQRTDTVGGVRAYRLVSAQPHGPGEYNVVDQFSNGQINAGHTTYTLKSVDKDRLSLALQGGHTLKLQRCK